MTALLDAEPDHRYKMPGPSLWPFLTAVATSVMFVWSIFQAMGLIWGAIPTFICLIGWFWPTARQGSPRKGWRRHRPDIPGEPVVNTARGTAALDVASLPRSAFGQRSVMWWATMCMIAIEGTAFALAITSYLYLKGRTPTWPPAMLPPAIAVGNDQSRRPARLRLAEPAREERCRAFRSARSPHLDGRGASIRSGVQCHPVPRVRRAQRPMGCQCVWIRHLVPARPSHRPRGDRLPRFELFSRL